MPAETDRGELRGLQRKAYGRDGGLTDAEALRLIELQRADLSTGSPVAAASAEGGLVDSVPFVIDSRNDLRSEGTAIPDDSRDSRITVASDQRTPWAAVDPRRRALLALPERLRRSWWFVAAASVLLLSIGVGAGWALFGQRPEIVSLTAEQQERRLALYEEGAYDEGSVRAVGEDEDALVWYGTRNDGEQACLVIDIAQASSGACQDADDLKPFGLSASVMVPPNAGSDAESGVAPGSSVNVTMMLSTTGEPMVSIQRWSSDLAMISQFSGTERDRATELIQSGFTAGLLLVGDFLSEPVWLGTRFSEASAFVEYCMIVDGAEGRTVCTSEFDAAGRGVSTDVEGTLDGVPTTWNLRVQNTRNQTPYLTIAQTVSFATPGERMELGGEHGDPIEVTIPSEPAG